VESLQERRKREGAWKVVGNGLGMQGEVVGGRRREFVGAAHAGLPARKKQAGGGCRLWQCLPSGQKGERHGRSGRRIEEAPGCRATSPNAPPTAPVRIGDGCIVDTKGP